jgi:hypothetical protein
MKDKGKSMQHSTSEENGKSSTRSWLIIAGIALAFSLWGLCIYFTVGDKGPPPWGFGNIEDIPGESFYSSHKTKLIVGPTQPPAEPVEPQHVMEKPKQPEDLQEKEQK